MKILKKRFRLLLWQIVIGLLISGETLASPLDEPVLLRTEVLEVHGGLSYQVSLELTDQGETYVVGFHPSCGRQRLSVDLTDSEVQRIRELSGSLNWDRTSSWAENRRDILTWTYRIVVTYNRDTHSSPLSKTISPSALGRDALFVETVFHNPKVRSAITNLLNQANGEASNAIYEDVWNKLIGWKRPGIQTGKSVSSLHGFL